MTNTTNPQHLRPTLQMVHGISYRDADDRRRIVRELCENMAKHNFQYFDRLLSKPPSIADFAYSYLLGQSSFITLKIHGIDEFGATYILEAGPDSVARSKYAAVSDEPSPAPDNLKYRLTTFSVYLNREENPEETINQPNTQPLE